MSLPPHRSNSVTKILSEVSQSKHLTVANRYSLMAAMFDKTLPESDRQAITKIIHRVMGGHIEVTEGKNI